jgi:hypothetical protein
MMNIGEHGGTTVVVLRRLCLAYVINSELLRFHQSEQSGLLSAGRFVRIKITVSHGKTFRTSPAYFNPCNLYFRSGE